MRTRAVLSGLMVAAGLGACGAVLAPTEGFAKPYVPHPACRAGSARCPVVVHLVRGGPARTVRGNIKTTSEHFDVVFRGRKGEVLTTRFKGPTERLVISFPHGGAEGPGYPEHFRLPQTGRFKIDISPDLMADGILGRFAMTLRLR